MKNPHNRKGFTIIEVVLVLAIAGLIFLMVFVALPALQRSQRDTARREDMSRLVSQIEQFKTNNRGVVPACTNSTCTTAGTPVNIGLAAFVDSYMKQNIGEFDDPQGARYTFIQGTGANGSNAIVNASGNPAHNIIMYGTGVRCAGENIVPSSAGARAFAVRIRLEGSGYFCQDSGTSN